MSQKDLNLKQLILRLYPLITASLSHRSDASRVFDCLFWTITRFWHQEIKGMANTVEDNLKTLLTHASTQPFVAELRRQVSEKESVLDPRILALVLKGHVSMEQASDEQLAIFSKNPLPGSFELFSMYFLFRVKRIASLSSGKVETEIESLSNIVIEILHWKNSKPNRVFKLDILGDLIKLYPFFVHFCLKKLTDSVWGCSSPEGAYMTLSILRLTRNAGLLRFEDEQVQLSLVSQIPKQCGPGLSQILEKEKGFCFKNLEKLLNRVMVGADPLLLIEVARLFTENRRKSALPSPREFKLLLFFCEKCLKSSYPAFRNEMVTVLKKFFERLRKNLQHSISNSNPKKVEKEKVAFGHFQNFMKQFLQILLSKSRPETPFESVYVMLEIFKFIFNLFGSLDYFYKGILYPGSNILERLGWCDQNVFDSLCLALHNSAESTRYSIYSILSLFPKNAEFLSALQVTSETDFGTFYSQESPLLRLITSNALKTNVKDIEVYAYAQTTLFSFQRSDENKRAFLSHLFSIVSTNFCEIQKQMNNSEKILITQPIHLALSAIVMIFEKNEFFKTWKSAHVEHLFKEYNQITLSLVQFINRLIGLSEGT